MSQTTSNEYLNRENIDTYFHELALEIKGNKLGKHRILVVGGAAMALKFMDGRSTIDIDICYREQNNLYSCCKKVAAKYDLPNDWLNADVMHSDSFSYALFDNAYLYRTYDDILEVFIVSDLDLYCMKLIAFRPKDIQDMIILSDILTKEGVSKEIIINNIIRLYGDEYLLRNDPRKTHFLEKRFLT